MAGRGVGVLPALVHVFNSSLKGRPSPPGDVWVARAQQRTESGGLFDWGGTSVKR
jgi:hypothetical protein